MNVIMFKRNNEATRLLYMYRISKWNISYRNKTELCTYFIYHKNTIKTFVTAIMVSLETYGITKDNIHEYKDRLEVRLLRANMKTGNIYELVLDGNSLVYFLEYFEPDDKETFDKISIMYCFKIF